MAVTCKRLLIDKLHRIDTLRILGQGHGEMAFGYLISLFYAYCLEAELCIYIHSLDVEGRALSMPKRLV